MACPPTIISTWSRAAPDWTRKIPDTRITNVNALPPGPFQLTNGDSFVYDSYAASPVHRFYQMWQQLDCSLEHATRERPSGCDSKLFSWVEVTVGAGANGVAQPANFSTEYSADGDSPPARDRPRSASTTCRRAMCPTSSSLADKYAMSDNFHQSVNGGTGANHIMLGHGDAIWFSDGGGTRADAAAQRPGGGRHGQRRASWTRSRIPTPRRAPTIGTAQDGYGAGSFGSPVIRRRLLQQLLGSDAAGRGRRSCNICRTCRARSIRTARSATTTCSITTTRATSATATTPTRTPMPTTPCLRFRPPRCAASATACWRRTSPGSTTAISGTTTCPIRTSSITVPSARHRTSTATSATRFSTTRPS